MITPDITKLKNAKGKSKNKRNNIVNVLGNLESVFNYNYFHYKDKLSESKSELEDIAERIKFEKQRFDEIANKEKKINPESFRIENNLSIQVQVTCTDIYVKQ